MRVAGDRARDRRARPHPQAHAARLRASADGPDGGGDRRGRGVQAPRRHLGGPRPLRAGADGPPVDPVARGAHETLRALDAQAQGHVGRDQPHRPHQQRHAPPGHHERPPREVAHDRCAAAVGFARALRPRSRAPARAPPSSGCPAWPAPPACPSRPSATRRGSGRRGCPRTAAARRPPPGRPPWGSQRARRSTARARGRSRHTNARRPARSPGRRRPPCAGRSPGVPPPRRSPRAATPSRRSPGSRCSVRPRDRPAACRATRTAPCPSRRRSTAAGIVARPQRERGAEAGGDEDGAGQAQAGAQRAADH